MPKPPPREQIVSSVVEALRDKRIRVGMSMNMLAEKSGLSLSMISFVERGMRKPTLDTLLRMAEALNVSLGKLIRHAETLTGRK